MHVHLLGEFLRIVIASLCSFGLPIPVVGEPLEPVMSLPDRIFVTGRARQSLARTRW